MCTRRKASVPEDLLRQEPVGLPFILAPGVVTRLQTYKQLAAQKSELDGSFLCDLKQNPGFGPGSGLLFPSMCTHPCIFCERFRKPLIVLAVLLRSACCFAHSFV